MLKIILLIRYIRGFIRKLHDDCIGAFSAQTAFFIIISFFPFIMFLLTLLQYVPLNQNEIMTIINKYLPSGINSYVFDLFTEFELQASGTIISITAITALWSASRGFLSIIRGLNSAYGIKETRNYFKIRFISTIYTLAFAVILIVTMLLLVFGNTIYLWIEQKLPVLNDLALLIISIRTVTLLLLLTLFFTILYIIIPNRKSRIMNELPGAALTSIGWMGFSYLYSFYIQNMGNFQRTYGSLTAIVLFMLWLYACMFIMFIGAEINVYLKEINWRHLLAKLRQ